MGAYIKNLKTLPAGKHKACVIVDEHGARLAVDFAKSYEDRDLHLYPITLVPPHGRLIDADALNSRCKDEKGCYYGHDPAVIGEAVESAPTIIQADPAEEG